MYGFLIVNFCVTASVWVIYSRAVKSRVKELEERTNKHTSQADPTQPGKKLFKAYFGRNLLSESMAVRKGPNRLTVRQPDVARSFLQSGRNLNSQIEFVVKISVAPTCECGYYKKSKGNQLCKHIICVYIYQLKVDEERCLIQQIALERNEVMQMVKIPRVKAILSKDKRNDQGRTWYLSHKEKNVGKIHVVRPSVVKGKFHLESCVSLLRGYQWCNLSHPKFANQSSVSVQSYPAFSNSHYG